MNTKIAMQGNELRELRMGMKMNQLKFAALLGLSPQFIGMMERGERPIGPRTELAARYIQLLDNRHVFFALARKLELASRGEVQLDCNDLAQAAERLMERAQLDW
jgi:transcriptional regulator with XRE-family HTH domain